MQLRDLEAPSAKHADGCCDRMEEARGLRLLSGQPPKSVYIEQCPNIDLSGFELCSLHGTQI